LCLRRQVRSTSKEEACDARSWGRCSQDSVKLRCGREAVYDWFGRNFQDLRSKGVASCLLASSP
jgi:hypothetical protein